MTERINNLDQVRGLFDSMAVAMENANGEQFTSGILTSALKYLATKQRDYKDNDYFDQIERGAVYLREATTVVDYAFATFVCRGEPILASEDQVLFYVQSQRVMAQEVYPLQVNFIRNGCSGCNVHDRHHFWTGYQKMRQNPNRSAYVEELEFACIYYQAMFMASQYFCGLFS